MSKDLDNAFVDVRNAFRLLAQYQLSVLDIVRYVQENTLYTDMRGQPYNIINRDGSLFKRKNSKDEYANLNVFESNPFNYLYSYFFEFYFGEIEIDKQKVAMSVIQVSDDGFYKSMATNPSPTDISTFFPADDSNSYLIFTAGWNAWLRDETESDYDRFLHKFLAGSKDLCIYTNDKGYWAITKRYPMQRFSSQKEADKVLADFGRIVKDNTGIELFKSK